MILLQVLAALSGAVMTINDKIILSKIRDVKKFALPLFFFLAFFTGVSLPWLGKVDIAEAVGWENLGWFALMIFLAVIWNLAYYKVQQKEEVQECQVMNMLTPLATAFLAALFFRSERNIHILIAVFIAGAALIFSRLRRHHLKFDQYSWRMVMAIFVMAGEILIRKVLLSVYSPASLYFFRTAIVFLVMAIIWPNFQFSDKKEVWWRIIVTALLAAFNMVASFYGLLYLGVAMTVLILMITPVTVYFLDAIILREKLDKRNIMAAGVILGCIVYAVFCG